jgi:hypothetical protein
MLMFVRKIFFKLLQNFFKLGQNPRKCWSKHDDTPPNVDGFATSLQACMRWVKILSVSIWQFQR